MLQAQYVSNVQQILGGNLNYQVTQQSLLWTKKFLSQYTASCQDVYRFLSRLQLMYCQFEKFHWHDAIK